MKLIRINISNDSNNDTNVIGSSPVEEIDDIDTSPPSSLPKGATNLVKLS